MGTSENVETVRRFYAAGPADDDAGRHPYAAPGIVWHVPGANHVSGRYEGIDDVFGRMPSLMQPLDRWDLELLDVMANGDLVTAVVHLRAGREEHAVDCHGAHVFRLDDDARIVEAWGFVEDQDALDALFDSVG